MQLERSYFRRVKVLQHDIYELHYNARRAYYLIPLAVKTSPDSTVPRPVTRVGVRTQARQGWCFSDDSTAHSQVVYKRFIFSDIYNAVERGAIRNVSFLKVRNFQVRRLMGIYCPSICVP
jgi:hypothetical protein